MQIFGIGPLELLFILVIMILILGPRGMVKAARESGKYIRKVTHSPLWAEIVGTSREIRNLPAKIIKDAGIQEEIDELRRSPLPELDSNTQQYLKKDNGEKATEIKKSRKKKSTRKNGQQKANQSIKKSPRQKI
jgi:sec-independent protein translocase protein TatB